MWVITSYYNPMRYKRRLSNYRIFRKNLATPLVTVELSFDGKFELAEGDADILIQISGGAIVWQKERLLNIAVKSVPRSESSVAWLDCDVTFERADWMDEAQAQLEMHNVVQLYSELVDLRPTFDNMEWDPRNAQGAAACGVVSFVHERGYKRTDIGPLLERGRAAGGQSMGLAWAARRHIIEEHGLYDAMVIGAGDRVSVGTMYGQFRKIAEVFELNSAREQHYLKWARPYHERAGERIGYVPGRIYHLWHGDLANRKTLERHHLLARFDFDPDADLLVGSNGAWQWARPRPDLEEFFTNYFMTRAEDG